jgi:cyanophycin synthetase
MTYPDFTAPRPSAPSLRRTLVPADLTIEHARALRGANPWHDGPAVLCELRLGRLARAMPADAPGFLERLSAEVPWLRDELAGDAGEALVARRPMGALLPALVHELALELQRRAGCDVAFGRALPGDDGRWTVVVAYEEEEVGRRGVELAVGLVREALAGAAPSCEAAVAELADLREAVALGPSTRAIVDAARRRGIPVRRLDADRSLVRLGTGRHQRRIQAAVTGATSCVAAELAGDKDATKRLLEGVGLPVPRGAVAGSLDDALAAADDVGYPVLLKPVDGNHGRGVSGRVADAAALRAAWPRAAAASSRVVVERFADGRDHRVLVVGDRVVACAERVPAHVVGDGRSTIRQLVAAANRDPRRGDGHARALTRLPLDDETAACLARAGRTPDAVPAAGERVPLRETANLSTGGTSVDRTDALHPDNAFACVLAARAVGLDVAGIDVLTPDPAVPFAENGGVIVEVNAGPGLRMHVHPAEGRPRDVGGAIVDHLFPPGAPTRVPVLAVTGTNGKTTTTRLLAHLLRRTGRAVGFTTTDGVYFQDRRLVEGDMTGPHAAELVLANPLADVAVLEVARGGLLRAGLGFDACDVGVVLNVAGDHLGLRGVHTLDQLAEVKAVVPRAVAPEGWAVLDADDPRVRAMRERTRGRVALFSMQPPGANAAFEAHLAAGGVGARVEDDAFTIRRGAVRLCVAGVRDVPLTLGGAARFQLQNVLAAVLAAHVHGVPFAAIAAGLATFHPCPELTPGRMTHLRVGRTTAVVDYAHNVAAVEALLGFVARFDARRRVGVVTVPGDRRDEDIRAVGRLCAAFDRVILKEDDDRRGRAPGEIARLLHAGLRDAGAADDAVEQVLDEEAAVAHALATCRGADLVVVLAEHVEPVLAQVRRAAADAAAAHAAGGAG